MSEQFHLGTFLWGAVLVVSGAALTAVGLGWWDISAIDLRLVGPVFVILIGAVVVAASIGRAVRSGHEPERHNG
jgi:hypothetical protein